MSTTTSTHRSRRDRWLLLAVMAALLLSLARAFPVVAASTLTPSENPVIIAAPAQTKTIALAWTLDKDDKDRDRGQLVVTENGGPVVLNQSLVSAAGSTPLTVTCGKSYDAKLRNADNVLVAQVTIVAQRPGRPPASCGQGPGPEPGAFRILKTNVTAHGTYAAVKAEASKPASFIAEIGKSVPDANGVFAPGDQVGLGFLLCCTADWTNGRVYSLQPDTAYHWVIRAQTTAGETAFKTGTLHTLKRRVDVAFETAYLIDDSDSGLAGDCDCIFYFKAVPAPKKVYTTPDGEGVPDGVMHNISPDVTFALDYIGDTLTLRAQIVDQDCLALTLCSLGLAPTESGSWTSGSHSEAEWGAVNKTVSVLPLGAGAEAYSKSFVLTSMDGAVKFHVWGTYSVSYY